MDDDQKQEAVRMATRVRLIGGDRLAFWCPACDCAHHVSLAGWGFNNDLLRPTLNPSILVTGNLWKGKAGDDPFDLKHWPEIHCHCFVRDGNIEYCSDSKHALAGQTVPIPFFQP